MENASKALLIAGAILIAILLIAIGMMVFNSASGVVNTAASGMSDHEITMHNKKFTIYEGVQPYSVVKAIVQEIITNNSNSENPTVKLHWKGTRADNGTVTGYVVNPNDPTGQEAQWNAINNSWYPSKMYIVECFDSPTTSVTTNDGVISRIKFTEEGCLDS